MFALLFQPCGLNVVLLALFIEQGPSKWISDNVKKGEYQSNKPSSISMPIDEDTP